MKIRTIAKIMAAMVLSATLVPTSSAQDNKTNARDDIEVITIVGKRPTPTVASVCVNEVMTRVGASGASRFGDGNFSGAAQDSRRAIMINIRREIRRCIDQNATATAAQS